MMRLASDFSMSGSMGSAGLRMVKKGYMSMRLTNLDVRAYAMERGVRLKDIAHALGIDPGTFSVQYMRLEQTDNTKETLKAIIREIESKRCDSNEEEKN